MIHCENPSKTIPLKYRVLTLYTEQVSVTVVIPAYRESRTIQQALCRILEEFESREFLVHLVVVLDGPDDDARDLIEAINSDKISVIILPQNSGKGFAIRAGCRNLTTTFTAFLDADLDINPVSVINCIDEILGSENNSVACAYGSKFHPKSEVVYPVLRRIASSTFRRLVRVLFGVKCADTQTGVKVFRTPELVAAIEESSENRFLLDLEILWIMSKKGFEFVEAPVVLNYQYSSTINIFSALRILVDLVRLRMKNVRSY